ncbi:uncharacterized protein K452DRAFT_283647 [Aplosporella prunicola CBS 121167]|uniref:Uncharacterized protein n=1 Tax=Aplosporella prunicola CBS 121167 TaxID=1176127 RepID=A0A6A6BSY1_9PEZI|nr:uncharacterized protein K452DRAFT_283647 [Aplosporella prunicola CBS 121167]KAF2146375.1 hypothetical protein K452DRAFT_283647 [Aplosporella prunicola CBS 121167]
MPNPHRPFLAAPLSTYLLYTHTTLHRTAAREAECSLVEPLPESSSPTLFFFLTLPLAHLHCVCSPPAPSLLPASVHRHLLGLTHTALPAKPC